MLARTGDSLQGIKKGVLELADVIAVNKADGAHEAEARAAARELADVLRMLQPDDSAWRPPALTCSALEDRGIAEVWQAIEDHRRAMGESGELEERRARQEVRWMWSMVHDRVTARLREDPAVAAMVAEQERLLRAGGTTAALAAEAVLGALGD
jgi:LAO/AO transport system kinase